GRRRAVLASADLSAARGIGGGGRPRGGLRRSARGLRARRGPRVPGAGGEPTPRGRPGRPDPRLRRRRDPHRPRRRRRAGGRSPRPEQRRAAARAVHPSHSDTDERTPLPAVRLRGPMHIKTLLTRPAITTGPATPLRDAHALMRRRGIRHLPVVDTGRLVGMLAERDVERASASSVPEIARHDWIEGLAGLVVADAVGPTPLPLHAQTAGAEAARLARDRGVDAFPVLDDGLVVGVVTRSDLLAVLSGLLAHRHPTGLDHVLAATSLRPGAARALGEALRIAATTGAALTALHVRAAARPIPGREEQ